MIKPAGFIPVIGSLVLDNPTHLFEKKYVFKVMYADSKTEAYLATRSQIELQQWVGALTKVQVCPTLRRILPRIGSLKPIFLIKLYFATTEPKV